MTARTSTLIVGGGPAGATAARFLAEAGIDTILAERDFSYIKPCGGGIPSGGFVEFALPEEIVKNRIEKVVIVSPSDNRIEIKLAGGHICITERGLLDSCLRRMAADRGASLIEGEFIGFENDLQQYISFIRMKGDGRIRRIRSNYILAADGITFKTGRTCNLSNHNHLYTISTQVERSEGNACEFWFGAEHASNFYSWFFPSAGHATIGTGAVNPRVLPILLDKFAKRRFGLPLKQLNSAAAGRSRIFPIPEWTGRPLSCRNILFLGDAAGMVMPVTYEGIYYAMKSGQFAASAIIEQKPERYQQLWEDRFRSRFLLMNKLKKHFFKSNKSIEKWVSIHRSAAVQDLAMRLWLQKDAGPKQLYDYLKIFGSILAT